jgi:hypothetical protein
LIDKREQLLKLAKLRLIVVPQGGSFADMVALWTNLVEC